MSEKIPDIVQTEQEQPLDREDTKIIAARKFYSGPIPDPLTLQQYEQVLPGSADRILTMAEKEQSTRHENNSKLIKEITLNSRYGIIISGIISVLCIIGGTICALADKAMFGLFLTVGGISTIVATFLKYTALTTGFETDKENVKG